MECYEVLTQRVNSRTVLVNLGGATYGTTTPKKNKGQGDTGDKETLGLNDNVLPAQAEEAEFYST